MEWGIPPPPVQVQSLKTTPSICWSPCLQQATRNSRAKNTLSVKKRTAESDYIFGLWLKFLPTILTRLFFTDKVVGSKCRLNFSQWKCMFLFIPMRYTIIIRNLYLHRWPWHPRKRMYVRRHIPRYFLYTSHRNPPPLLPTDLIWFAFQISAFLL